MLVSIGPARVALRRALIVATTGADQTGSDDHGNGFDEGWER